MVKSISKLGGITRNLVEKASVVADGRLKRFEYLKKNNNIKLYDFSEGFVSGKGELGDSDSPCPKAPIKYVLYPQRHIEKFFVYLPFFLEHRGKDVFEVGVGPGYLFLLLRDLYEINMSGIDIRLREEAVYRELRSQLGIEGAVFEHKVMSGEDIPIPTGTEILIAFWTVFNKTWDVEDHEWFLAYCAQHLTGRKLLYLRFNDEGFADNEPVRHLYRRVGETPLPSDRNFVVVKL